MPNNCVARFLQHIIWTHGQKIPIEHDPSGLNRCIPHWDSIPGCRTCMRLGRRLGICDKSAVQLLCQRLMYLSFVPQRKKLTYQATSFIVMQHHETSKIRPTPNLEIQYIFGSLVSHVNIVPATTPFPIPFLGFSTCKLQMLNLKIFTKIQVKYCTVGYKRVNANGAKFIIARNACVISKWQKTRENSKSEYQKKIYSYH